MASPSDSSRSSGSSLSPAASIASPPPDADLHSPSPHHIPRPNDDTEDAMSTISSDTSGSIPGSQMDIEEEHEQVTFCNWQDCNTELHNMDALVAHIHDSHIGTRRAKYACEWIGCARLGMAHASGYALRAHMRSHTREKPFYCTLPECDRSFTRSDALAKHMRTVHETEALRPSDPIPKNHPNHPHNISAQFWDSHPHIPGTFKDAGRKEGEEDVPDFGGYHSGTTQYFAAEDGFDPDESRLPPKELYRLLKKKIEWAEAEGRELEREKAELEERRRGMWVRKELILEKVLRWELGKEAEEVVAT